jgi:uncharacterized protein (TIGR02001 family)
MLMNSKSTLSSALLAALLSGNAVVAQTKAPEPDYTLAYNIGVVTDYRFRGMAQTNFNPALQGGADFSHKSGFYLGAWASNVSWVKDFNGASKGNYEVDLYGGYKGEIAKGFGYDVGLITYQYPGNNSGAAGTTGAGLFSNASTNEIYGALTYSYFTLKYSRSLGDFLGNLKSGGSQYLDLSANFDLGNGLTLTPHLGRQTIPNQAGAGDYTDYALTIAKDFGNGLAVSAAAIGTNANKSFYTDAGGRFLGKSQLVVGLKYSF